MHTRKYLAQGEQSVIIVTLNPGYDKFSTPVDECDFTNKAIIGLQPAIKTKSGKYVSPLTGEEIVVQNRANIQVRTGMIGDEFTYPSGETLLLGKHIGKVYFDSVFNKTGVRVLKGTRQYNVTVPSADIEE